jgi:hypothetical protein
MKIFFEFLLFPFLEHFFLFRIEKGKKKFFKITQMCTETDSKHEHFKLTEQLEIQISLSNWFRLLVDLKKRFDKYRANSAASCVSNEKVNFVDCAEQHCRHYFLNKFQKLLATALNKFQDHFNTTTETVGCKNARATALTKLIGICLPIRADSWTMRLERNDLFLFSDLAKMNYLRSWVGSITSHLFSHIKTIYFVQKDDQVNYWLF